MTDPSREPRPGTRPDGRDTGTPRWVKVFGAVLGAVILVFVVLLLVKGPGGHGPSRHMPAGEVGGLPSSIAVEHSLSGGAGR